MARAVPEFQGVLTQLAAAAEDKIGVLIPHLDRLDAAERRQFITDAYPTLITPYLAAAGDLTAQWYDEQPTTTRGFRVAPAALAPAEQLAVSGRWALTQSNPVAALQGSSTRAVFNSSRRTVLDNVGRESGARWARHASANACAFCRMLATRTGTGKGSLYTSKTAAVRTGTTKRKRGKRAAGEKYHDHCHCVAVPVRPGDSYEPPPYVQQWTADYRAAVRGASKDGEVGPRGAIDTAAVVRRMEEAEKDRRAVAAGTGGGGKPPTGKPPVPAAGGAPEPDDLGAWLAAEQQHQRAVASWLDAEDEHLHASAYYRDRYDAEIASVIGELKPTAAQVAAAVADETPLERSVRELNEAIASGDGARIEAALTAAEKAEAVEKAAAARRAAAAAKREAADRDKWDRIIALIENEGWDPLEAEAEITGKTVAALRRRDFMARARADGHEGVNFEALLASVHREKVAEMYLQAENATRGQMVKRKYALKFDPATFWSVSDATARKYMSEELAAWFDENGRLTRATLRDMILSGSDIAARHQQDYLQ